jgi:hypothetical protein
MYGGKDGDDEEGSGEEDGQARCPEGALQPKRQRVAVPAAGVEESALVGMGKSKGEENGTPHEGGGTEKKAFEERLFVQSHQTSAEEKEKDEDDESRQSEAPINEAVGEVGPASPTPVAYGVAFGDNLTQGQILDSTLVCAFREKEREEGNGKVKGDGAKGESDDVTGTFIGEDFLERRR